MACRFWEDTALRMVSIYQTICVTIVDWLQERGSAETLSLKLISIRGLLDLCRMRVDGKALTRSRPVWSATAWLSQDDFSVAHLNRSNEMLDMRDEDVEEVRWRLDSALPTAATSCI